MILSSPQVRQLCSLTKNYLSKYKRSETYYVATYSTLLVLLYSQRKQQLFDFVYIRFPSTYMYVLRSKIVNDLTTRSCNS